MNGQNHWRKNSEECNFRSIDYCGMQENYHSRHVGRSLPSYVYQASKQMVLNVARYVSAL